MDVRQLRTFVTVAEEGTVARASSLLRIAQPALSRQIKALEDELGVSLFDRVRRRLALTTEGKMLLTECRSVLKEFNAIKERARLLQRPDVGIVKVAGTPQTIDGVLAAFLGGYAKERPNIQVTLIEGVGSELVAMVDRGDAHVALVTAGGIDASNREFDTIWLPSLEFMVARRPREGLPGTPRMDIRALGAEPLLLLNKSFAVRSAFDAACRVAEFKPNIYFESLTPHTLLALAEAGLGTAIVPSVLPTHRYKLNVATLTYRNSPLREAYAMILDKRRARPPAAEHFCRALRLHVRESFPISRPTMGKATSATKAASARQVARRQLAVRPLSQLP